MQQNSQTEREGGMLFRYFSFREQAIDEGEVKEDVRQEPKEGGTEKEKRLCIYAGTFAAAARNFNKVFRAASSPASSPRIRNVSSTSAPSGT